MSRLANAWDALMGRLPEAVIEEVEVGAEDVTLYRVDAEVPAFALLTKDGSWKLRGTCWPTCSAAFAAIKGFDYLHVEEVKAVRVGRRYFLSSAELKVSNPRKAKRP